MKRILATLVVGFLLSPTPSGYSQNNKQQKPRLEAPSNERTTRTTARLAEEVRHQLVTLPYYDVFDWLEGEVLPDGSVTLKGEVTEPSTKSSAESRVKSLEGVNRVSNQIEVLPVSSMDNEIRRGVYVALFNFNSPLFMYGIRAVPPIHIIVKGGRVTLKGLVRSAMDRQLAEQAARGVPGTFEVRNELKIEAPTTQN
jgi:hyperosmotically inducible protein